MNQDELTQYRNDPNLNQWALAAHRNYGANQRPRELTWLINQLSEIQPINRVLEIGSESGGTFWLWCQLAVDDARLMCMDNETEQSAFHSFMARNAHDGYPAQAQQTVRVINDTSRNPARPTDAAVWFGGQIDFMFIDGDHSYEGVSSDFYTYGSLVHPGGRVAFHDIDSGTNNGVQRFWEELQASYGTKARGYIDPLDRGMGIGIVTV